LDASTNAKGAAVTDLYLIAHKVRGEPAFDIAQHMTCPKCNGTDDHCTQCDGAGHWWIIPTSGHRAFPWWSHPLDGLGRYSDIGFWPDPVIDEMPPNLRDHYTTEASVATDLIKVLGLIHKPLAPAASIKRRF
jgi:hypothetical protein